MKNSFKLNDRELSKIKRAISKFEKKQELKPIYESAEYSSSCPCGGTCSGDCTGSGCTGTFEGCLFLGG